MYKWHAAIWKASKVEEGKRKWTDNVQEDVKAHNLDVRTVNKMARDRVETMDETKQEENGSQK